MKTRFSGPLPETKVQRCQAESGLKTSGFLGSKWLAYRCFGSSGLTALVNQKGEVQYFATEEEAKAALDNPELMPCAEYLARKRKKVAGGKRETSEAD